MDSLLGACSGPATLITTLILLTIYMNRQGEKWASLGLRALPGAKAKLLLLPQAFLIFVSVLATITLLTKGLESIGLHFMSETPEGEMERWGDIEGNLQQYLILIALSWISAGFGEEMFFRGFVITRLQTVFNGTRLASALAVLLSALLFGYVHFYYQGLTGLVNAGVIGLIFGAFFLLYKRYPERTRPAASGRRQPVARLYTQRLVLTQCGRLEFACIAPGYRTLLKI